MSSSKCVTAFVRTEDGRRINPLALDTAAITPSSMEVLVGAPCKEQDSGTDLGFFAGRSAELEQLSDRINDTGPGRLALVTGSPGTGKSALLGVFASALAPVLFDAGMPTGMHLAVRGVLDTGLAARAVGAIAGTALGSVVGSAWILAGQLQESVRSLEPASETSVHKFDDVVDVVRDLQHRLGIDLKDVLAAASIKPRTY